MSLLPQRWMSPGLGGALCLLLPSVLQACPFCAEAVRRINNGHLLDSYVVAYVILAFMPLVLIGLFALTLYRFHRRKTTGHPPQS